jgi:hypothetical protein
MEDKNEILVTSEIVNRRRVKQHRQRRREAGLKEIKVWVMEKDIHKIFSVLHPFLKAADNVLHLAKGGRWPKYKISAKDKLILNDEEGS